MTIERYGFARSVEPGTRGRKAGLFPNPIGAIHGSGIIPVRYEHPDFAGRIHHQDRV